MVRIVAILSLFSLTSLSQEMWLCSEESSQLRGDGTIAACGVGEAQDEGTARRKAFDSAKAEFNGICGPGSECGDFKHTAEPKRTTCEGGYGSYKCYRLVVFRVIPAPRRQIAASNIIAPQFIGKMNLSNKDLLERIINRGLGGR